MKNKIKFILVLVLIIPVIVLAEGQLKKYFDATNDANNYINRYTNRNKYILLNNVKFKYENRTLSVDPVFTKGGLLNKSEFDLSVVNNKSYLMSGREYWTMTDSSEGTKYYVDNFIFSKSVTAFSGARVTEQVKGSVKVTGKGTYANPWVFEEGYEVTVKPNNSTYATITPTTQTVKSGGTASMNISITPGYKYANKDDCNLVKRNGTSYEIRNVIKDISCVAIFERVVYKMNLTSSKTYASSPSPSTLYYIPSVGWYSNPTVTAKITKITPPTITGYTFNGFKYGNAQVISNSGQILTNTIPGFSYINEEQNLTADITARNYTLSYESNGGSACSTKTVTYDSAYGSLCTPTKTGYTLEGWYKENTFTTKVTSTTVVSTASNHTLYAKWTANNYTVTYSNDGGSGCSTKSVTYDDTYGSLCTPTKTGYTFGGWYKESGLTNQVTSSTTVNTASNHTLYAKWTKNRIYIRYHVNGGSWAGSTNTHLNVSNSFVTYDNNSTTAFSYEYGATLNLANYNNADYINISKTGYIGVSGSEWCTSSDGTGTCYNQATDYTNVGSDTTASTHFCDARTTSCTVTLYVNWGSKPVRLYYHPNGGELDSSSEYQIYNNWISSDGSSYFYQQVNPGGSVDPYNYTTFGISKTGYNVPDGTEWCTSLDGTGTCFDHDVTKSFNDYKAVATEKNTYYETDLYTHWAANTYTVVYNANGGTGTTASSSHVYGTAKALTANGFSRTGYTFDGWATTENGAKVYNDKQSVSNLTTTNGGTVNLYAKWKGNTYVVTLSGKAPIDTTFVYSKIYTLEAATNPAVKETDPLSLSKTKTYIVSFDYRTTVAGDNNYLHYDLYPDTLPEGPRLTASTGYKHYDWEVSSNKNDMTSAKLRFYSYVTAGDLKIRKIMLSEKKTMNVTYGDKYTGLTDLTKTGYTFSGWYNNSITKVTSETTVSTASNHVLHARWTPIQYTVKFNKNNGTGTTMDNQTFTYDSAQKLTKNTYKRTGYTFEGWATSSSGSKVYDDEENVSNLSSTNNAEITLYAKWKKICCPQGGYHYNGYCYTDSIGNTGEGTCGSQGYDYYNGQCYTSRYQDSC